MTRIDFYAIADSDHEGRMHFACRLIEKAFALGNKVLVLTDGDVHAQAMDELLWTFKPESFIPHLQIKDIQDASAHGTDVVISNGDDYHEHHDVLVNLTQQTPAFFSRFQRLSEIVMHTPDHLQQSREHYKFYQHQGYPIHFHDLRERP